MEQAEKALFVGNYEQARREFQDASINSSDEEVRAAAAVGMGRALYLDENYSTAIETLDSAIVDYPDSPHLATAYFTLARCYQALDQYEQAAQAYARYLQLKPGVLDAYVQELRGDVWMAAGNASAAVEAYTLSIAAPQEGSTIWTQLKLGQAFAAAGDDTNAIKTYLEVYDTSDSDYARAQANLLLGQVYTEMGLPEQAHARYLDSITNFPTVYDAYSGLVQLVNDEVAVDDLTRGIVDYHAGQYSLAVDALNRHIETNGDLTAQPFHFRALSLLAQNEAELALQDWDYIIANFPTDSLWVSAWDEKAYTLWAYLDDFDGAAATLLDYIAQAPESAKAPEFLFQAGRIQERSGKLAESAATWEQIIDRYPASEYAERGLFLAGISHYRAGDYAKSLTVFQRALLLGAKPEDQAAAYLWIGKSQQAAGDLTAAHSAWQQAAQLDPTGYYSERANELLQNREPFSVTRPVDLGYDLPSERAEAEAWLLNTFSLPAETNFNGLAELAGEPRVQRGLAFWELGLYNEARSEFEALRQQVSGDALQTYRLMNQMLDMGLYRSAILASRQILDLAGMDDLGTLKAPNYFNHIRFGVYFKDQVLRASQDQDLHPLFLLSVMRQESLFEGFAISGAGARGLMQIMPATGQEIASSLNWVDYRHADLYRPEVSIAFGSSYLARQRAYFGGSLYATLAAYNGGPGNTMIWNGLANNDPDLLIEVIRADETRKYIKQIYEFFNIYRILYERGL